jgi:hypothetical protein
MVIIICAYLFSGNHKVAPHSAKTNGARLDYFSRRPIRLLKYEEEDRRKMHYASVLLPLCKNRYQHLMAYIGVSPPPLPINAAPALKC